MSEGKVLDLEEYRRRKDRDLRHALIDRIIERTNVALGRPPLPITPADETSPEPPSAG